METPPVVDLSIGTFRLEEPRFRGWPVIMAAIPDEDKLGDVMRIMQYAMGAKGEKGTALVVKGMVILSQSRDLAGHAQALLEAFMRQCLRHKDGTLPTDEEMERLTTSDVLHFIAAAKAGAIFDSLGDELKNVFGPVLATAAASKKRKAGVAKDTGSS